MKLLPGRGLGKYSRKIRDHKAPFLARLLRLNVRLSAGADLVGFELLYKTLSVQFFRSSTLRDLVYTHLNARRRVY